MEISGRTGLFALIGTPVGHSKSPVMYNYSFKKLDLDYRYLAFDITIDKVKEALLAIKTFNIKGANVTMPCKSAVTEYMDELSPAARIIGACNTIVNDNGKLVGHITDGVGYVRNLKENGVEVKGKKITIMGAGGAATAIQVQCALDGAREISIFNPKDDFYKLTNATLIGMKPYDNETNIKDTSVLRKDLVVTDVVYNPKKTKMIEDAEANGCKAIGGLGMLLYQGAEAFNLYTGLEMPVEEVNELCFK